MKILRHFIISFAIHFFFAWFTAEYSNLLKNYQKNEEIIYKKKSFKRHFWKLFFYFVKAQGYLWGQLAEKIRNSSVIGNRWSRRACKIISTRISIKKCYVLLSKIKGRIMSKSLPILGRASECRARAKPEPETWGLSLRLDPSYRWVKPPKLEL